MKAPLSWLKDYVDIDISAQELADKLCVSKSCLNHRMRKLMSIAEEKEERKEETKEETEEL